MSLSNFSFPVLSHVFPFFRFLIVANWAQKKKAHSENQNGQFPQKGNPSVRIEGENAGSRKSRPAESLRLIHQSLKNYNKSKIFLDFSKKRHILHSIFVMGNNIDI